MLARLAVILSAALVLGASVLAMGACARSGAGESLPKAIVLRREGSPPVVSSPQAMLDQRGVRQVQRALRRRGFNVPLDGAFGERTRRGLLTFQRRAGLAATSMPDLATLDRLGIDAHKIYRSL